MSTYRHKKTGRVYREVARGLLQTAEPISDMEPIVHYVGEDGRHWFRPVSEFGDLSRFEPVPAAAPSAPAPAEVPMPEAYDAVQQQIVGRYVVVERTGGGFWGYAVKAGDGDMELHVGHRKDCENVRAALQTACLDGAWLAAKNAAAREAAAVERVRGVLEADAMRFRWLTEDHADPDTRAKCRELLSRMAVMSYSAACTDIDSAMAQATKREMLRTAIEWRRYQPTCAHGRYGDEDCADCQRTAAARAELGEKT